MMLLLMVMALGGEARPAEQVGGDGAAIIDTEGPKPRKRPRMAYPRRLVRDRSQPLRCGVEAKLDDRGRVAQAQAADCEPSLYAITERKIRRFRWDEDHAGAEVAFTVRYVPPVDVKEPPEAMFWRHRVRAPCQGRVQYDPSGQASVLWVTEGCEIHAPPADPTPAAPIRRTGPKVCPVSFVTDGALPVNVDVYRCPLALRGHARRAVASMRVSSPEPVPWPYGILLQFDGPVPAPAAGD